MKAGNQAGTRQQSQDAGADAGAEDGLKSEEERLVGFRHPGHARRDSHVEHHGEEGDCDQGDEAIENAARHIPFGVVALFGRERQLFDPK